VPVPEADLPVTLPEVESYRPTGTGESPLAVNILLQVLDDGRLTDSQGHVVSFKNAVIIMTSNIGAELIQERFQRITDANREQVYEETRKQVLQLLQRSMRPEFLNRVDEALVFQPLTRENIAEIVDKQFQRQVQAALRRQGLEAELTPAARESIAAQGYDPVFGARPLKRIIQRQIINELSRKLLAGEIEKGDKIVIDAEGEKLLFRTERA